MSERACSWAQDQDCPTKTAKFLLMRLGAYADADGVAWAYVERLAKEMQTTDRTVQRCLRALEVAKLIERTGGFHHRNVPYYRLRLDPDEAVCGSRTVTRVSPLAHVAGATDRAQGCSNGDTHVTVGGSNGDMGVTVDPANGDTGVTPKQRLSSESNPDGSLSEDGRARGVGAFERFMAAYPESGAKRTDWRAALAAFDGAAGLVAAERLIGAAERFAADPDLAKGDFGAPAAERWLAGERWRPFLPPKGAAARTVAATPSPWPTPPDALRRSFAAKHGDALAASYFPVGHLPERRLLVARTGTARDWLRANAADWLTAEGLSVCSAAEAGRQNQAEG